MIQNNNLSPLPFYKNDEYLSHNKQYAYGSIYNFFCENGILPPFQIVTEHGINEIENVQLYDRDNNLIADVTDELNNGGLTIKQFAQYGYDVIVYPSYLPLSTNMQIGVFYLKLFDGVDNWRSEYFTNVASTDGFIKIEWWDNEDFVLEDSRIVYDGVKYHNVVFLNSQVGKPEYKFVEEGETRDGYFFPEKQLSEKVYKFTFIAPEYLCDVMRFIRMADNVVITDELGREYDCDTFLINVKWQAQGDLASVEVEFETATIAKKVGRAHMLSKGGDFENLSYNNDYSINQAGDATTIVLELSVYDNEMARMAADTTLAYDVMIRADAYLLDGNTDSLIGIIPAGQSLAVIAASDSINYFDNVRVQKLNNKDNTNYIIKTK
jgi:hypothetical protein